MSFNLVSTQSFSVDGGTYRVVHCWESAECLVEEKQKEFVEELWKQAERKGIPTAGERCQHEFDCCGKFYAGFLTLMYIDWSYGQVFTYQMFHRNV